MSIFNIKYDKKLLEDNTGVGNWINTSGVYEVTIKAVIVDTTPGGSVFLNLWLDHQGQLQPIYQAMRLTNNNGDPNKVGVGMYHRMAAVIGVGDNYDVSEPVPRMIPMGAGGKEVECMVLEDFDDQPIKVRVQMEYELYNGKIKEKKIVRNYFRIEDNATAAEIIDDVDTKGSQYEKELQYADKVSYKDGLTEEDVQKWISSLRGGSKAPTTTDNKPSQGFGKKRTFGRG